nr:apolipoprotein B-100 [Cavia porcellus]
MGPPRPELLLPLLLLLLLPNAGAQAEDKLPENVNPSCPKEATRFKHLRKYVYSYEAESSSGIPGKADSRSITKINCKVELEVPQLCSFVLKTSQCTLKELHGLNLEGKALLKKTKNSEDFAAAMSRHELRLAFPEGKRVFLYPEEEEPKHILNIKRGIVSALLAPPETEEDTQELFLDTVYGNCSTRVVVKTRKGNVATEMSTDRNLQECTGFQPSSTGASPLALIRGLARPLSTLVSSSQSCQYTLDPKRKHVSEAVCREQHLFLPFSYKNKYGMMTQVTQTLKLEDTPKINSRFFGEGALKVGLAFENTKSTFLPKQAEAVLKTLQELKKLTGFEPQVQRANLFSKLVTNLRGLSSEDITSLLPRLIEVSSPITLQALIQCGQPQCYTHVLQWLRSEKAHPLLIDVVTYLVALIPDPSAQMLRETFNIAKEQLSRATLYALSHMVNNYFETTRTPNQDLRDIANYLQEQIQDECAGDEEHTYLILRVIGNMGRTLDNITPTIKSSILRCIGSSKPSMLIQKAAIQALRKMQLGDEAQQLLLQTFVDSASPGDKRLAAYLTLMKKPSQSDIGRVIQLLPREENEQVKNFVVSHIANILSSEELYIGGLKALVKEALKDSQLPTIMDFSKFSRNYQFSKSVSLPSLDPVSAKIEGNLIFDPNNYLPKESMLKTTLTAFGFASADLFEIGLEGKGFEPTLEALFGKQGFFPDSVSKALYWVNGQVPDGVSKVLVDHFGYTKDDKHEQDMINGIIPIVDKLIKDLKSRDLPEARAYLRILGKELSFFRLQDLRLLGRLLLSGVHALRGIPQMIGEALREGWRNDLFLYYIFMDNTFELPTGMGLQLQVSSSGVTTLGTKAGVKLEMAKMQTDLVMRPSVSVEFVTSIGIIMPDFARSGVRMNTNVFCGSSLEAHVALKAGELRFIVVSPKRPIKLFSISNTLHLVSTTKTEVLPPLIDGKQSWVNCRPLIPGLNFCSTDAPSNASATESASYYPLTGNIRYGLELRPTGDVEQYSVGATYELQREENALVDRLKFAIQAEGKKTTEATLVFKYNRRSKTLSSEMQIPDLDIDLGTILRVTDESSNDEKSYKLNLDFQNKKITEVAFTGHVSHDTNGEGKIKGVISIPRLQAEARSEISTHWSPTKLLLHMDSSATAYGSAISKRVVWRYDDEKIEFQWNTGTNVDTKKAAASFPVDPSDYLRSLHMHANKLLDHRIPQTGMTFSEMGSKLIVTTNTWLQEAANGLPYAQILQDHLSSLKELNLEKMWLPYFHLPDNLFLKSDGRIKYILNKNSIKVEIPLPFGGKSSRDLKMLETIRTPALSFKSLGFQLPSQEFQVPSFTIPEVYQLRVPLLGVLDLSTNVHSNLYNLSASYTGGNTSRDHFRLQARYHIKADSVVNLLSYSLQGSGETTYDHRNTFTLSCDGSLRHQLLDSNVKLSHVEKIGNNPASKGVLTFDISSTWGPQMSASVHLDSKMKQQLFVKDVKIDGQLRASSFYAEGTYGLTCQRNPTTGQLRGESNLRFNSSYLQGTNQMTGVYEDGALSLTSTSNLQGGTLKNTASLKYENYELTLKSDTSGNYENLATSNKVDLTFSKQNALLRSEYQADYKSLKFFSLLAGSLNSQGVELNADILGTDKINAGAHKATLRITRDGISTSATTNLKYSPLFLENELNAALGLSGASMKLAANGRFREHSAKFSVDGKAALTEVSLASAYQAMLMGVDSKNVFSFRLSGEGLKVSNDLMGSYGEMTLDHANSLSIAGLSLEFSSKLDNIYSADKFYKQNFNFQLQPFSLVTTLNNDLKYSALDLTSSGKLRLEPLKLNVGGNLKAAYQNNEIKHIYTISYADLSASYKADTLARIQGAEFSHRLSTGIAGLAASVDISTNYHSDSLRFNSAVHSALAPFTVAIDAHVNGNGKLALWGEHTGQLYSKFLLKAEPLALTFSHDYKGSTSHNLSSGKSISAALDHRLSALLTPTEQTSTWKLKTQLNNHEYSQDFDAYNTKDKIGVELSGRGLADLTVLDFPIKVPLLLSEPINVIDALQMKDAIEQPQEFTVVAFVKYDKNQDVHTISLPFLKTLPEYLERNRIIIITTLEIIQRELKRIDIDQFVKKYGAGLSKLPQQVSEHLNALDWERQIACAKKKLTAFAENYRITENDLQTALNTVKINLNEKLSQFQTYVMQFDHYIINNYDLRDVKRAIAKIIDQITKRLKSLDERYQIRVTLVRTIHSLYLFVENVDFNKMASSTASWIQNVDTQYQIRVQIQEKLEQIRTQIQNLDIQELAAKLKQQVEAIDIRKLLNQLRATIPVQKINTIIEHVKYFVINLINDFEVVEKINAFRAVAHELIKKYDIDRQIQVLIDKSVQLAHQYKLKDMVQKLSNALQQVDIKDCYEKLLVFIDDIIRELKEFSFKTIIEDVNHLLDILVKELRSFDYHQFVNETNDTIREVIQLANSYLDLPQKAEALKLFIEDVKVMLSAFLEKLKDTKITLFVDWLQNALNSAYFLPIKAKFQETLEDMRDRIYQMDIQHELERYLSLVGQVYNTLVTYISDWWGLTAKNLADLAEQYSIQAWAANVTALVEQGFTVPKIQTFLGTMPAFEVSLRALQQATFQTPDFVVPLTDLKIPSVRINFKELKDIKIPSRFSTPQFTILNTFHIPSFTIDLKDIKVRIIRTIDQMLSSELRWPVPEVYLRDLKVENILPARLMLPDFSLPEITIPEFAIPNLNLSEFRVPDLHIPEFQLPPISHTAKIPAFGKLNSILKIQFPLFTIDAQANVHNVTISEHQAGIEAFIGAKGESKFEIFNFDFQANAQLLEPMTDPLLLKESMNFSSKYLRMGHGSEIVFSTNAIEGKSGTVASFHTEKNTLELKNGMIVKIKDQLTLDSLTKYSHKLNIPKLDFSSKAELINDVNTRLEAGHVTLTSSGAGSWKWACPNFSDEGTHESQISFTMKGPLASLELANKINSKHVRVTQNLAYESGFLNFSKFDITSDVESQHVGHSVLNAKGIALLDKGKVEITGDHNAHLNGKVIGTLKNSLFVSAQPFEMTASANNEGNLKVSFPLKLTGKIDFLNNYALLVSPAAQQANWQASARFNQYKYNQNFSALNNENSIEAHVSINGDANLEFLNVPLTIPEMNVSYIALTTPSLKDFNIWEATGLKEFLKTTKQSVDLNVKIQYKKNKDKHSIAIPLGRFYKFINENVNSLDSYVANVRDNSLDFLTTAYKAVKFKWDEVRAEKSRNAPPRTFQYLGYTIPVISIEVSPFSAEIWPFSHVIPKAINTSSSTVPSSDFSVPSYTLVLPSIELPELYIPRNLFKLSLPDLKELSDVSSLFIPAMGNMTYDFSFKSSVITLNTNAGLYNQSDIVAHFLSSSSFVIDALQYKLEGTLRLTRKRGLKLATALSLSNKFVEGSHDSTISFTKKNMEASLTTSAKVHVPVLRMNFKHELNGNTKSKPAASSSIELKYDFNAPEMFPTAKGAIDHKLSLESLTSYFSIESSTKADIKGLVLSREYSGALASEASTYLNSKATRSSVKLQGSSKVDGIWNVEVKENFAGEATPLRIYTMWEHSMKDRLRPLLSTHGEHTSKATLELFPGAVSALIQVRARQLSSLFDIPHVGQEVVLNANTENQKFGWKSEVQIHSGTLKNSLQLSNDQKEARFDIAGTLEGHLHFLKFINLPVYDKSLWDLLKLDVTTSPRKRQHLHAATALVYTKNPKGFPLSAPVQELTDKFVIPGLKLNDPYSDLITPTFQVPFTNLQVPSFKLDFSEIKIYKKLSSSPFAVSLPKLPKVKVPQVNVFTKYSEPGNSSVPYFEITVPEVQLTVSQFTLPKSLRIAGAVLDLNKVASTIGDFELPTITVPEQTIEIPSIKFSVPAGVFLPLFGALTARFGVASPLYNATWNVGLKNNADHVETFLDSTCSSTLQFLEYDLNVVGTYKIDDAMLSYKIKGTLDHSDLSAEYEEDGKYKGLEDWEGEASLDFRSPAFTELHLRYQEDRNSMSSSAASPAIGTVGLDLETEGDRSFKCNLYFQPQSSSDKKLTILKMDWKYQESGDKTQMRFNWEEEAASRLLSSLKDNVPKATGALYDYADKYHQEYTGLNLKDASAKLKRSVRESAEGAFRTARRQLEELEAEVQTAASSTTGAYQEWKKNAQDLYQDLLAEEGQNNSQRLKDEVFDSLIQVTHKYHKAAKHLIHSFIDFLKLTRIQLPGMNGTYTRDELCTIVMREIGKILSQVYSNLQNGLEKLLSYTQDLVEKSEVIRDLQIELPYDAGRYKLTEVILNCRKLLEYLSQEVQKALIDLQSIKFSEKLSDLQSFLQIVFQEIEAEIKSLKETRLSHLTNTVREVINTYIPFTYGVLKEGLSLHINELVEFYLQTTSQGLLQIHHYVKALREEYFDPSIIGWTVKYYELEEKIVDLIKHLAASLKDLHSMYTAHATKFASQLSTQVERFVQEYLSIFVDADGKGRVKIAELSNTTQEGIQTLTTAMKEIVSDYQKQFTSKLQELSDQFSDYHEKVIALFQGLIDLSIENYHMLLRYITEVLAKLQAATAKGGSPSIQLTSGELIITI